MIRRGPPGGPRRIQGERLMFGPGGELCSITGNPKTSDVQGCAASLSDACIDPASTISRVYDDLEQRVFAFLRKARNTGAAIIAGAYLAFTPCHARADQALADEVVDYLLTATEQPTTAVINQYDHNDDGTIDAADVVRAMSMPAEWHTVYENEFDDGIWLFVRDAGLWKRDTDESREIGEHTLPLLDKIRAWATQYTNRHKA